jgi:hypothetical protein
LKRVLRVIHSEADGAILQERIKERSPMRHRRLGLATRTRRGTLPALRSRAALAGLALVLAGCAASPSLVPREQADAIRSRDRALAPHAEEIQTAIRQSGTLGALAFLDVRDGRLVVFPGNTPEEAWARQASAPERTGMVAPAVVTFVYRADVPAAPAVVNWAALQQHHSLHATLRALEAEIQASERRAEERVAEMRRELAASRTAAKEETDRALAAASTDAQRALRALADDVAAVRAFSLQTAQLGWLTHELSGETTRGIRRLEASSQAMTTTSARLATSIQQLSDALARQLKELGDRLEAIRSKIGEIK